VKGITEELQSSTAIPLLTIFALKYETACEYQERVADRLADACCATQDCGQDGGVDGSLAVVLHEELRAELAWTSGTNPAWAITLMYADGMSWSSDVRAGAADLKQKLEAMMRFRAQYIADQHLNKWCGECMRPIVCARAVCPDCSTPKCARCIASFLQECSSTEDAAEVRISNTPMYKQPAIDA
jgi:hypothetical protein